MIIRSLDSQFDWTFGKGKNDYKTGIKAQAQNLDSRINSFAGDCFFNTAAGIDWFNLLGAKDQLAIQAAVSAVILNTQNVQRILDISANLNNDRRITLTYEIKSVFGTVSVVSRVIEGLLITETGNDIITEDGEDVGA